MCRTTLFNFILKVFLAVAVLVVTENVLQAQNPSVLQTVSPYSRYGIGDFQFNGGLINTGMGGGGIALRNDSMIPQYINLLNPASLTAHQLVTYEVSLASNTVQLSNASSSAIFNRTTLGHLALAFPVSKRWGAAFGLTPYSSVGYNVSSADEVPNLGPVTYKYEGAGGVNQVFLANAIRPFAGATRKYLLSSNYDKDKLIGDTNVIKRKVRYRTALTNISVGFTASYLYGSLTNIRRDVFPDSLQTFNTKIAKSTTFRDVYFNAGLQYTFRINRTINPQFQGMPDSLMVDKSWMKNKFVYRKGNQEETRNIFIKSPGARMTIGAVIGFPAEVATTYELLAQTYKQVGTIEQIRDTVSFVNGIPSRVQVPLMAGGGFAIKKDWNWMIQADYSTQLWSGVASTSATGLVKNSHRVTAGFQWQPKIIGRGNYFSAVQYRLGMRYHQTALEINNVQLRETAINFSVGMPAPFRPRLSEPIGRMNMSFEVGRRGTIESGLLQENFFRVSIGMSINDRWFTRYKID